MTVILLWGGSTLLVLFVASAILALLGRSTIALVSTCVIRPVYLLYLRVRGPAHAEYYGMHRPGVHPDEPPGGNEIPEVASVDMP